MARLLVLAASFFMSLNVHAFSDVICPTSLVCDGDAGTCAVPFGWDLRFEKAYETLSGIEDIKLETVVAQKYAAGQSDYLFSCHYGYGAYSTILLNNQASELLGSNWMFSGFGNSRGVCAPGVDPVTCTGKK